MKGFTPGLFDRLMDVPVRGATSATVSRMSSEDLKGSAKFPECSRSIVTYGLNDFAGRSLSITALLVVSASQEPVNFDAHLQPSTLHYSISKARHAASAGA